MIIIDMSQIMMAGLSSSLSRAGNVKVTDEMIRFVCLNSLKYNIKKFKKEFGPDVIIACDGKNNWRKKEFPYYKANRKVSRDASKIDFKQVYQSFDLFKAELKEYFPYTVIEVEGAEADDVIGTICHEHGTDFGYTDKNILIISGDHDFIQLQTYHNVKQWNPVQKKFVKYNQPLNFLQDHIFKGDTGDGVPNIFSDDDTLVTPGKRQKVCTAKRLDQLRNSRFDDWDEQIKRNFERNSKLIDLDQTPSSIKKEITEELCKGSKVNNKVLLHGYFINKKLGNFLTEIQNF